MAARITRSLSLQGCSPVQWHFSGVLQVKSAFSRADNQSVTLLFHVHCFSSEVTFLHMLTTLMDISDITQSFSWVLSQSETPGVQRMVWCHWTSLTDGLSVLIWWHRQSTCTLLVHSNLSLKGRLWGNTESTRTALSYVFGFVILVTPGLGNVSCELSNPNVSYYLWFCVWGASLA